MIRNAQEMAVQDANTQQETESAEMRIHELKTWRQYFEAVANGTKTFEIRKNDRDFRVGDWLALLEYDPIVNAYVVEEEGGIVNRLMMRVSYVTDFAQQNGYVVLGLTTQVSPSQQPDARSEGAEPLPCDTAQMREFCPCLCHRLPHLAIKHVVACCNPPAPPSPAAGDQAGELHYYAKRKGITGSWWWRADRPNGESVSYGPFDHEWECERHGPTRVRESQAILERIEALAAKADIITESNRVMAEMSARIAELESSRNTWKQLAHEGTTQNGRNITRAEAAEAKLAALTLPANFDESALGKDYVLPELSENAPGWWLSERERQLREADAYHRRDLREIRRLLIQICEAAEAQGKSDSQIRNLACGVVDERIMTLEGGQLKPTP